MHSEPRYDQINIRKKTNFERLRDYPLDKVIAKASGVLRKDWTTKTPAADLFSGSAANKRLVGSSDVASGAAKARSDEFEGNLLWSIFEAWKTSEVGQATAYKDATVYDMLNYKKAYTRASSEREAPPRPRLRRLQI